MYIINTVYKKIKGFINKKSEAYTRMAPDLPSGI